jgi:hypothetical protein
MPENPALPVSAVKLANIDVFVWLIIFVMVAVAKGWSKLQQPADDDSSESDEAPPVVRPRPQIPRPQPQPRPAVAPIPRATRPPPRTVPRTTARPVPPPTRGEWKVDADQIRRFIEQMGGKAQPPSPSQPVPPPPAREAEPPAPPPQPEPARDAPAATQTTAKASAPAQVSRASQWAEALRDRNNIRNIIISAEIIGPPRAESA